MTGFPGILSELVDNYAAVARPIMRKYMNANSCIAASRVTMELFRLCGVDAVCIPVKFVLELPERKLAFCAGLSEEECATALGQKQVWADGWSGHVCVVVEGKWFLDPSFDQAFAALDVENKDLQILALPIETEVDPYEIAVDLQASLDAGERMVIRYRPLDDRSFTQTEAWNDDGLPWLAREILQAARLRYVWKPTTNSPIVLPAKTQ